MHIRPPLFFPVAPPPRGKEIHVFPDYLRFILPWHLACVYMSQFRTYTYHISACILFSKCRAPTEKQQQLVNNFIGVNSLCDRTYIRVWLGMYGPLQAYTRWRAVQQEVCTSRWLSWSSNGRYGAFIAGCSLVTANKWASLVASVRTTIPTNNTAN